MPRAEPSQRCRCSKEKQQELSHESPQQAFIKPGSLDRANARTPAINYENYHRPPYGRQERQGQTKKRIRHPLPPMRTGHVSTCWATNTQISKQPALQIVSIFSQLYCRIFDIFQYFPPSPILAKLS